jgi:hypothetical protein
LLISLITAGGIDGTKSYHYPITSSGCRGATTYYDGTWDKINNNSNPPADAPTSVQDQYLLGNAVSTTSKFNFMYDLSSLAEFASSYIIRIKALHASTYVNLAGLTKVTRAASTNEAGDEVRVAEENKTDDAAPHIADYALFVGNGRICQSAEALGSNPDPDTCDYLTGVIP